MINSRKLAKRICAAGIMSLMLTSMPYSIMAEGTDASSQEAVTGEVTLPEGPAGVVYLDYINKADTFEYSIDGPVPTGQYRYAFAQISTTESAPALLLNQICMQGLEYIRVFQYVEATGEVLMAQEPLMQGVAGGGGFRGSVAKLTQGVGVLQANASSGTGETEINVTTFENGQFVQAHAWSGRVGDVMPDVFTGEEIVWTDISQAGAAGQGSADAAAQPAAAPASSDSDQTAAGLPPADTMVPADTQLPTDGNRTVLTGTINTYDYWQTVELQGQPDPNAAWANTSRTYRIIVLDQPQNLTGLDIDDNYFENQVEIISVDYADIPLEYDGTHITFSISPDTFYWPSDTGLPLGAPSTDDVHILQ